MVYCSGQIPAKLLSALDSKHTHQVSAEQYKAQTDQVIKNLSQVLEASGSSLEKVVKTTVFLLDLEFFSIVNEVYQQYFSKPYPARSTVEVKKLPKGALIEIEAIGYID